MDGENSLSQENDSTQNKFNFKNFLSFKTLTTLALLSILINIAYVELSSSLNPQWKVIERITKIIPFTNNIDDKITDQLCPQACISQIYEATTSVKIVQQPTSTPEVTPTPQSPTTVKEFFIPFGSGSSLAGDWEDISGVQATLDTDNFPSIKSVTFEATVRIPTGNETGYIRLYNVTDKRPIWSSEISWEGGGTKLLTKAITLDSGSKLYQVQMKTSLKFQAIFDQARLHIITY